MDHYAEFIVVFLIMFPSTLMEKSTLINLSLEKSENIKDFHEILNHFFPLFFSKLFVDQNSLKFLSFLIQYVDHECSVYKYYNMHQKKLLHSDKIRFNWIDVLQSIDILQSLYLYIRYYIFDLAYVSVQVNIIMQLKM